MLKEKEKLYTPSEWSKRYKPEEVMEQFMKFCTEVTEEVRESIKCELDVPYGTTERTIYDIYGTDLPKDAPILVFIHGGYWQEFSKDLTGFSVPLFVKNKIKVITVEYDLCPNVRVSDIIVQVKSACEQILKYAADNGCKSVLISGHSAGAHLAASLLHDVEWMKRMEQQGYLALLKGIVLIAGLYDIRPIVDVSHSAVLNFTDEEVKRISWFLCDEPKERIHGLKVIVTIGDCDSPAFIDDSCRYIQKIISMVNNVEFHLLRDIDHFDIVEKLLDPDYVLAKSMLHCLQSGTNTR
ncbi:Probable arylformamidase [Harpegnathos saltator]|uniref:Kynurenine formamidase n=1 Tax=Harpegnathos saltator TaxID=610380 RepID=E2BMI6_HARSA|nr:Probable arylformamidase [Harpegnathos saltator]